MSKNSLNNREIEKRRIYWCMRIMSLVFVFSVAFGYWSTLGNEQSSRDVIREIFSQYGAVKSLNIFMVFLFIFLNNAIKGFLVMISGIFFGISAVIFTFINGELIGLVLGVSRGGMGPAKIILGILPHGILEIPAIILSATYGLWLGYHTYRFIQFSENFKPHFSWALKQFASIVLPLLLFAAFIEAFITPIVLTHLLR